MNESEEKELLKEIESMIQEAERKGLWLKSKYQNLWFSPEELRKEVRKGHFRWGRENWTMRDPKERKEELIREERKQRKKTRKFTQRMK